YPLVHGARIRKRDSEKVKAGELIAEWDPFMTPIITDVGGAVHFEDIVDTETMEERVDPNTGLATKVITASKQAKDRRPTIIIRDTEGRPMLRPRGNEARYSLPEGAYLNAEEGTQVMPGDVIAKIARETTKTKDITGGLPRVAELFEARKPKEVAVISEIDGVISFGKDTKGKRKVIVTPEVGEAREYLIPKGKHISVHEGDYVKS